MALKLVVDQGGGPRAAMEALGTNSRKSTQTTGATIYLVFPAVVVAPVCWLIGTLYHCLSERLFE